MLAVAFGVVYTITMKQKCQNIDCNNLVVQKRKNYTYKFCSRKCANITKARNAPSPFSDPEVQKKVKETFLSKYGVDNPWKVKSIQEKCVQNKDYDSIIAKTVKETKRRHGEDFYKKKWKKYNQRNIPPNILKQLGSKAWLEAHHKQFSLSEIARQLGVSFTMVWSYACEHGIDTRKHTNTSIEYSIEEILKHENVLYTKNDRQQLGGKEIDFYLPEHQLGIEVHGLYWHSEKFHDKNHLRQKYELAKNCGISLIQFTEEDIKYKLDIVHSIISNRIGKSKTIGARKCKVAPITDKGAIQDFYNCNHIQGHFNSKVNLGLLYQNELVALMSFSKTRFSNHDFELTRFASLLGHQVLGGASRLFSYFCKHYSPGTIISYSDMQYFTGNLYTTLKFVETKQNPPNYSYIKNDRLLSRMSFQKKKIQKEFPDADLNELEESLVLKYYGYLRFYHVGHRVHVWTNS